MKGVKSENVRPPPPLPPCEVEGRGASHHRETPLPLGIFSAAIISIQQRQHSPSKTLQGKTVPADMECMQDYNTTAVFRALNTTALMHHQRVNPISSKKNLETTKHQAINYAKHLISF